jgi:hypothetical protein
MDDNEGSFFSIDEAPAGTRLPGTGGVGPDVDGYRASAAVLARVERLTAVVESRALVRDFIRHSMQSAFRRKSQPIRRRRNSNLDSATPRLNS